MKYNVGFSMELKGTPENTPGLRAELVLGNLALHYPEGAEPQDLADVERDAGVILDTMLKEGEFYDIHTITDNAMVLECEPED
jgi:hypothetical protein